MRVVSAPDSVTIKIVSLQVVSIDVKDGVRDGVRDGVGGGVREGVGVDESVITVVVPDCVSVVSLHVVSIDDGGSEEYVMTVMVPDCVIVVSLHVVSQENKVLGAMDDAPIEVVPDDWLFVLVIPVEGVTTDPVDKIVGVPKLELKPLVKLAPAPADEMLLWALNVAAPVSPEVSIGTEVEFAAAVRVAITLVAELGEMLPDGKIEACEVKVSPVIGTLLESKPVPDAENKVPFPTGISVVRVVPVIVVGSCVLTVVVVMVVSMAVVKVVPDRVVGEIVSVSVEDETPVLLFSPLGVNAELEGRTDMAEELPLALVRLAPEEASEVGEVPEEIGDIIVTIVVVDPPLGPKVGLARVDVLLAENGGRLDTGTVEFIPVLVSRPDVKGGSIVLVPIIGVVVTFDD